MNMLAQQMNALASKVDVALLNSRSQGSMVIMRDGAGGGTTKAAFLTVALVTALAKIRGFDLSDLKPVTTKTLGIAMGSVGKSLTSVSDLVTSVRTALQERIVKVSQTVDEVKTDVSEVQSSVDRVEGDITSVRSELGEVHSAVDDIAFKQDYAARGIHALCGVVSELLKNASQTAALQNLHNFTLIGAKTSPRHFTCVNVPSIAPCTDSELDDAPSLDQAIAAVEAIGARSQEQAARQAAAS